MKFSTRTWSPFVMWLTLALLVMLGLQAVLEFRLLAPLAAEMGELNRGIKTLQGKSAAQIKSVSPPQARLEEVLVRLQQQPGNQTRIERLHQTAAQHGVLLRKAGYQNQPPTNGLWRHEVQADLSGSYPAIRQFLRDALAQDDALALESLEFSRPAGSTGVRAQVRLVFFSRP